MAAKIMKTRQAFLSGSKVTLTEDGVDQGYYQAEGRWGDRTWIGLLEDLQKKGYELSEELSNKLDYLIESRDQAIKAKEEHLAICIATASTTGKPVVVTSAGYHTSAGSGRNYAIVMPDGSHRTVTNGCASSSHSTASKWVGATEEILEAIAKYHNNN